MISTARSTVESGVKHHNPNPVWIDDITEILLKVALKMSILNPPAYTTCAVND